MAATQTSEKSPTQTLLEANTALFNAVVEAGYKAQTRGLNLGRVLVEGAGRQQAQARKLFQQTLSPATPWYSSDRLSMVSSVMAENSSEMLRIGREYIDELNAGAAESRQTLETIARQAAKAREAQQAMLGEGFSAFRNVARTAGQATAQAAGA